MSSVDNIILNGQTSKKKNGKGILIILFVLFFILAVLCGAYWYFVNYMQETPKTAFFKYVGQNNFNNIINTDIYYTMLEKMNKSSHKTETIANYTTTQKSDFTEKVDVSKFEFVLNSALDKTNETSIYDAKINYSSNDIFNFKLISTKDSIGIGSNEILDKYIATSKPEYSNSIKRIIGTETEISTDTIDDGINKIVNNKIDFNEEYKSQKVAEYSNLMLNLIPEEAVTEKENVIVTIDSKTINTNAYTLSVDVNKYNEILSNVLTKLRDDKELLGKIVTGMERKNKENQDETENQVNPLPNVQVDYTAAETEEHQTATNIDITTVNNTDEEQLQIVKDLPDENLVSEEQSIEDNSIVEMTSDNEEEILKTDEIISNKTQLFKNLIFALVFNQKIDCTVDELIEEIDAELENVDNLNEGVKITVYVKNMEEQPKETVKLVMELPNTTSIDIEYQSENKSKITYLEPNKIDEKVINVGSAIEIERISTDVKNTFNIQVSTIEDKKVIAKLQVELETEGSKASKEYVNDAIIKYNDSEGDFKININNKIDFNSVSTDEILNDENSIFVDKLTDEETTILYTQILQKIMQLYSEKMINLSFIDNNSASSVVQQPDIEENNIQDKGVIRQKLIDTVSNMMGEAQNNGTSFTIQDLSNLQIEGLNISTIITEDMATIKIDEYIFKIDKNFVLTEE